MCGICGVWGVDGAAVATFLGLHQLQHRGQESAGILSAEGEAFYLEKEMGILSAGTISKQKLKELKGKGAIGHVRYTTSGRHSLEEAQPFIHRNLSTGEKIAFVHNGQLNGYGGWQRTRSDSEQFGLAYAQASGSLEQKIMAMLHTVDQRGSYALLAIVHHPDEGRVLIAAKDMHGNRPLCIGSNGQVGYVFASESCAMQGINVGLGWKLKYQRELNPGEVIIIPESGKIKSHQREPKSILPCFFEMVYFARPDSKVFGHLVADIRRKAGGILAEETYVDADMVLPVPDSANDFAIGYAMESTIPLEFRALTRSHYIGRTFIDPDDVSEVEGFNGMRDLNLARKFGAAEEWIEGKRLVVVDDSLVRGNTMKRLVHWLYNLVAKEVHVRIGSLPTIASGFYGIDTKKQQELAAKGRTVEEVRR